VPIEKGFPYRAVQDGEYWFKVVTIDHKGQPSPLDLNQEPPSKIIVVDTIAPEPELQPVQLGREMAVQCNLRDANPNYSTVRVEHLTNGVWRPLESFSNDRPGLFRIPDPSILSGKFRVRALDLAGNESVREISLPIFQQSVTSAKPPVNIQFPDLLPTPPLSDPRSTTDKGVSQAIHRQVTPPPSISVPNLNPSVTPPPSVIQTPQPSVAPPNPFPLPEIRGNGPQTPLERPQPPLNPVLNPSPNHQGNSSLNPSLNPVMNPPDRLPVPPLHQQASHDRTPSNPVQSSIPLQRSLKVKLDTTLSNGNSMTPTRFEYWCMRDHSRTWERLGDNGGKVGVVELTLPGDGVYGLLARTTGGPAPTANEQPDDWIEVDTTTPKLNVSQPTLNRSDSGTTMTIAWSASDKNLGSEPINIYYSTSLNGPWVAIINNYRNDGVYTWSVPANVGPSVHIRVQAVDKAGNMGEGLTRDPVVLEVPKPRLRIVNSPN
jgi:hypothetical protein